MGVIVNASVSVDGFIAYENNEVGALFDWLGNGDTDLVGFDSSRVMRVSAASAAYAQPIWANIGATVIGRTLFDFTDGWGGVPAVGAHVFVVSHRPEPDEWRARFPDAPFTFVADVDDAVARAREVASERDVAVNAGSITGQALTAGLVDEICLDVVPVLLGSGVRFFGDFADATVLLENPQVVEGDRVTHLRYRVRREGNHR